jgi:hypothetical protein
MKIKPCPFCYIDKAKVEADLSKVLRTYEVQVICPKCGTRGPVFCNIDHGHDWAVQAWNSLDRSVDWTTEEEICQTAP